MLLCLGSLLSAGVVQAAHVHDAPISLAAGKHVLLAPAEDCPLCAATQVALPGPSATTVQLLRRVECVAVGKAYWTPPLRRWRYELFSRPPPDAGRLRS